MSDLLVTDYCCLGSQWKALAWRRCFVNVVFWLAFAGWVLSMDSSATWPGTLSMTPVWALPFFLGDTEEDPYLSQLGSALFPALLALLLAYLPWREAAGARFWTLLGVTAGCGVLHRLGPARLRGIAIGVPVAASLVLCAIWEMETRRGSIGLEIDGGVASYEEMMEFEEWLDRRGFARLSFLDQPEEFSVGRSRYEGHRLVGGLGTTTLWLEHDWKHESWLRVHLTWSFDGYGWERDKAHADHAEFLREVGSWLASGSDRSLP